MIAGAFGTVALIDQLLSAQAKSATPNGFKCPDSPRPLVVELMENQCLPPRCTATSLCPFPMLKADTLTFPRMVHTPGHLTRSVVTIVPVLSEVEPSANMHSPTSVLQVNVFEPRINKKPSTDASDVPRLTTPWNMPAEMGPFTPVRRPFPNSSCAGCQCGGPRNPATDRLN